MRTAHSSTLTVLGLGWIEGGIGEGLRREGVKGLSPDAGRGEGVAEKRG